MYYVVYYKSNVYEKRLLAYSQLLGGKSSGLCQQLIYYQMNVYKKRLLSYSSQ